MYNTLFKEYNLLQKWKLETTVELQTPNISSSLISKNQYWCQPSVKSTNLNKKKERVLPKHSIRLGSDKKYQFGFTSFDRQSESPFTTQDQIDFSFSNIQNIITWVCKKYQTNSSDKEFDENLLAKVMFDFGYLNLANADSKTSIQIAKFIENLTKFINLISVKNKIRLLIQIFYNFENRTDFKESEFFEELYRLSPQMDILEEYDINKNLVEVKQMIGQLIRRF